MKVWEDSSGFRGSRLTLGTVQFGLPYGIANRTGKPCYKTARDILVCAFEGGIDSLDTAAAYGSSESVLGKALKELGIGRDVVVATKVPALPPDIGSGRSAAAFIERSVATSSRRLQLDVLPICLFHKARDAVHMEVLADLRDKGRIGRIGISVDEPQQAAACLKDRELQAVQLPLNVLDKRMDRTGVLSGLQRRRVWVFARSAYLQGLLLLPEQEVQPQLREVLPARRALDRLAARAGMNLRELALRYSLSRPEVASVVVGVETVAQMRDNLAVLGRGPLPSDVLAGIGAAVPDLPERLVRPSLWPPRV